MDAAVQEYVDAIDPAFRPLFDRLHAIVLEVQPDAVVRISYAMPAYEVGKRRLSVGVWKHGISIYGWRKDEDGGFVERHPDLKTSTGTIQIRPSDADEIRDDELRALVEGVLGR